MKKKTRSHMLPPKKQKDSVINTGVQLPFAVRQKLDAIVRSEGVKSRNLLMQSFLAFAADVFPYLRGLEDRIQAVEVAKRFTRGEAIGFLVERGLYAFEKETKSHK